jgi:tetratricopeptide (TPR) repeat protein
MRSDVRPDMRSRDVCSGGADRPIPSIVASLLVAFLVALLSTATYVPSAHAEGAIAMGQTDTVGTDGLAFGAHYNDFDANRIAGQSIAECRISAASERAQNACAIIGTFHDRCFSLAQDDRLKPHGVGLSLAENRKTADTLAMDQCRKMAGSAHARACTVLRNGCDGDGAFRGSPIDATGFNDRAFASLNKRDYDHAAADFDEVIKFNPQNAAAYNDRAAAYKLKGDLDRALADYNQAIAIDPNYADAYNNRGTVHLARREFDLAGADFNQAITLQAVALQANTPNAQKSTPYINLGLIYDAKGDYDAANAQFTKAIAIDPKDEIAYTRRGMLDAKKSDYVAAIADFGEAIKLNPNDATALLARAEAKLKAGDRSGAEADIAAAKALRPDTGDTPAKPGDVVR